MTSIEDIETEQGILAAHRRTLGVYLQRLALTGNANAQPEVIHGIAEARIAIRQSKTRLREWGQPVEDASVDEEVTQDATDLILPLGTVPPPAPLPRGSRMPFAHNPLFVGREQELLLLATILKGGATAAIGPIAATTGLGGIGKTQLACEFVHHYGQFFRGGVFWLSFAEPVEVPREIVTCGIIGAINLEEFAALTTDAKIMRVLAEWQLPLPRLLIFDNCEDETLLNQWRPKTGGSRVLVTSRRSQWSRALGVTSIALDTLKRDESSALLRNYRPDIPHDIAASIATELGDLPLALHLAGSYLETYRDEPYLGDATVFLTSLRDEELLQHPTLQGEDITLSPTDHVLNIGKTFALSFGRLNPLEQTDSLAIRLLERAACFAPGQPIPYNLLLGTLLLPEDDRQGARHAAKAIHRLLELGLITIDTTGNLRLHRLIVAFMRTVSTDVDALNNTMQAIVNICESLLKLHYKRSLLELRIHIHHILDIKGDIENELVACLYEILASTPIGREIPSYEQETHVLLERAYGIRKRLFGAEHPDTIELLSHIASWLPQAYIGDDPALVLLQQSLTLSEAILGADHPDTAQRLSQLAMRLVGVGDLTEAYQPLERALTIRKKAFEATHPTIIENLQLLLMLAPYQVSRVIHDIYSAQILSLYEQMMMDPQKSESESIFILGMTMIVLGNYHEAKQCFEHYEQCLSPVIHPLGDGFSGPVRQYADKPRNLDFSIHDPNNHEYGWYKTGSTPEEYDFGMTEYTDIEVSKCKYIRSIARQSKGYAATGQVISAVKYRGCLLCLSAEIRTEEVQGSAALWLRADGMEDNVLIIHNTRFDPVQGNSAWIRREATIYVPKASVAILFGAVLAGVGGAWFRDMRLDILER